MMLRFIEMTFLLTTISVPMMMPFFQLDFGVQEKHGTKMSGVFQMILDIFPGNIVQPFLDGNSIQIIVLAAAVGFAMLILGNQATIAAKFVEQANYIVQFLMEMISSIVPFFIFISILQMILSGSVAAIMQTWKPLLVYAVAILLILMAVIVYVGVRTKAALISLVKKMMPSFMIALTTASSSASFGTSSVICEKKLGISPKIINFGVPLGTVMYMPGTSINYLVIALYMAEVYDVQIGFSWILMAVFITGILAIATPPIPGGALTCYTVMFLQLGIPEEAILVTMTLDIIFDFLATATNIPFLQSELVLLSEKLGLLKKDVFRKSEK